MQNTSAIVARHQVREKTVEYDRRSRLIFVVKENIFYWVNRDFLLEALWQYDVKR